MCIFSVARFANFDLVAQVDVLLFIYLFTVKSITLLNYCTTINFVSKTSRSNKTLISSELIFFKPFFPKVFGYDGKLYWLKYECEKNKINMDLSIYENINDENINERVSFGTIFVAGSLNI